MASLSTTLVRLARAALDSDDVAEGGAELRAFFAAHAAEAQDDGFPAFNPAGVPDDQLPRAVLCLVKQWDDAKRAAKADRSGDVAADAARAVMATAVADGEGFRLDAVAVLALAGALAAKQAIRLVVHGTHVDVGAGKLRELGRVMRGQKLTATVERHDRHDGPAYYLVLAWQRPSGARGQLRFWHDTSQHRAIAVTVTMGPVLRQVPSPPAEPAAEEAPAPEQPALAPAASTPPAPAGNVLPFRSPGAAMALYARASELDESRETREEAEALYRRAIALDPTLAIAHTNLGNVCFQQGRTREALLHYDVALGIDERQPEAHYNKGYLALEDGRPVDAIVHLTRALELNPTFADAAFNVGQALKQIGERDRARVYFRKYLELEPSSEWAPVARSELDACPRPRFRVVLGGRHAR